MKGLVLVAVTLGASTLSAAAMDVRPATEEEIATSLSGCWDRERTLQERRVRSWGIPYQVMVCFDPDGVVHSSWVGGDEGIEGAGTYQVSGGKLQLRGPGPSDGWTFGANDLDCDVLMSPGRAMRLMNCVGVGADAGAEIADSSFELST